MICSGIGRIGMFSFTVKIILCTAIILFFVKWFSLKKEIKGLSGDGSGPIEDQVIQEYLSYPVAVYDDGTIFNAMLGLRARMEDQWTTLPLQFLTTLPEFSNFQSYSNAPGSIYNHEIIDALALYSEKTVNKPEFKAYRVGRFIHDTNSMMDYKDVLGDELNSSNLDTFLHPLVLMDSWDRFNDSSWFIFADSRTFIETNELKNILSKYSPENALIFGDIVSDSSSMVRQQLNSNVPYILSRQAMKTLIANDFFKRCINSMNNGEPYSRILTRMAWYGNIELKQLPTETRTIDEIPFTKSILNQNVLSLQTENIEQYNALWTYSTTATKSLTYRDIFNAMFENFPKKRHIIKENWDNFAKDIEYCGATFESCYFECKKSKHCLSFRYLPEWDYCGLSTTGVRRGHVSSDNSMSGWLVDRL